MDRVKSTTPVVFDKLTGVGDEIREKREYRLLGVNNCRTLPFLLLLGFYAPHLPYKQFQRDPDNIDFAYSNCTVYSK